jgi:hypothetical protein
MKRMLGLGLIAMALCSASGATAGDKGTVVEIDGLKSKAPADWKQEKATKPFRVLQFKLPKVDGDPSEAELVVSYLEKGGGGGVDANLDRWKKKFITADGKPVDNAKVDKFKVGAVAVTYLDISGTFKDGAPGAAKFEKRPDYRMFGVIFESPNGPYFITLTGPARTLEQQKKGFDEWLKNFK